MNMWQIIQKRRVIFSFVGFVCLCVILVGSYAWFSIMQNFTNEFEFEPFSIKLTKVSADDESVVLPGAIFGLYDEQNNELGRYYTDKNGEINLTALPDGSYYFKELYPPYGYEITGDGKTELFSPPMAELVVKNAPLTSKLAIYKTISQTDLRGDPYTITDKDRLFPFEFTVDIQGSDTKPYNYVIYDGNNQPIADYAYTYEDGTIITQSGSGSIVSGGVIYLRHNEHAEISGTGVGSFYTVKEKNYLVYDDPDFPVLDSGVDEFGCEQDSSNGHTTVLTHASGWAGEGYNTSGNIRGDQGSVATFVNRYVPEKYEITISSLVVVDRILANPADVDYNKGFEVTIEIGNPSDDISYWYEIVHLENAATVLPDYNYEYDYYDRNDPGVPKQLGEQPVEKPAPEHFYDYTLTPPPASAEPGSPSSSGNLTLPQIPETYAAKWLHRPVFSERWPQQDGVSYGELLLSSDISCNPKGSANTIVAELHHGSSVIVYGIPAGTQYTVTQIDYRYIDGYIIDSTNKDCGIILPDLEVLSDDDTSDHLLLRTRADIYNYFVLPIMREFTIHKNWNHGANPPENQPASTTIQIYDPETNYVYDSRTYRSVEDWVTVEVPKYRPGTNEEIDYAISEIMPPGYVIGDLNETEDGFEITNVYSPQTLTIPVQKQVSGRNAPAENFHFELTALTNGAPMPENNLLTIKGEGFDMFESIEFLPTGVNGSCTYRYQLREVGGAAAGYSYDGSTYIITVTTTEVGNQITQLTSTYQKDGEAVNIPLVFCNQYEEVERSSLSVKKIVTGNNSDKNREFEFKISIDGYPDQYITLCHGESYTIDDLPVGVRYTVTEINAHSAGYSTSSSGSSGTITAAGAVASFINNKSSSSGGVGNLVVTKKVMGEGAETDRDFRFTVEIGSDRHIVYLKDGESWRSPPYSTGTSYSVTEASYAAEGYVTTSNGASGTISTRDRTASFTNTKETVEKSKLTVTKQIDGPGADPTKRFDFIATIGGISHRLTLAGGESYTFYDIPLNAQYTVRESNYSAEGYVTTSSGSMGTILASGSHAQFTNTQNDNIDPNAPGRLTVTKTVTGKFIDVTKQFHFTVTIGEDIHEFSLHHGQSKSFENIPSGTLYSVVEDDYSAQDYSTTSSGAVGTMTPYGATAAFINEYTSDIPPKPGENAVQISGTKTWVHGNNTLANQPKTMVVYIMNGTSIVAQKTVTAADNWSYAFNLPKLDENGSPIAYSVNEQPVRNYLKTIHGQDIVNTFSPAMPDTGDSNRLWIWFVLLAVGAIGLRYSAFPKKKRRQKP